MFKKYGIKLKKRKHARASKTRYVGATGPRGLAKITIFKKQASNSGMFTRTIFSLKTLEKNH